MGFFGEQKYERFGSYILLDRINAGGMAEVFRGKQVGVEGFEKLVALKRILPNISADEDFIEMFKDEAMLAKQMMHGNIVQIYDLGLVNDCYYIAMEYIAGVDLRTIWDRARKRNRLLPIAMSCYIMQRMCEGLDYAHRKKDDTGRDIGLVHRDISPQNVLVSFEGEIKVVDFGIAKAANKVSKTQAGILKGKFGYMSPEQVRGYDLDNRSDIFACGVCLWEMLVGERLFLGESDFATLEKVRNVEVPPPSQLNKSLSPQLERIVMKCLQKDRDDRYIHTSEVAEDLQRFLFSTNQPFGRTDLQRYLKQHFEKEIEKEYGRLEKYRSVTFADVDGGAPPPPAAPAAAPAAMPAGPVPNALQPRQMTFANGMGTPANGAAGMGQPANPGMPGMPGMGHPSNPGMPGMPGMGHPSNPGMPGMGHPSNPGMPTMPGGVTDGSYAGPPPGPPAPAAPAGLPGWAKGLIGGLSVVVLATLALVVYLILPRGPETGSLTIDVTPPDAEIKINSERVANKSPITLELPAKTHVIEIRKPGYKPVLQPLKVMAGDARIEKIVLEAEAPSGSLVIKSTPVGLAIWLDGKDSGKVTPTTLAGITPGAHDLVLKRGAESLYQSPVRVAQGGVETVEVDIASAPPVLEVDADRPGAEVRVDGRTVGATPLRLDSLRPGKVTVKVSLSGCDAYEESVELEAGKPSKVTAALRCAPGVAAAAPADGPGRLYVTATAVADIFVDGQKIGRTPAMGLKVAAGVHELKLVPVSGDKPPHVESMRIESGRLVKINHAF